MENMYAPLISCHRNPKTSTRAPEFHSTRNGDLGHFIWILKSYTRCWRTCGHSLTIISSELFLRVVVNQPGGVPCTLDCLRSDGLVMAQDDVR